MTIQEEFVNAIEETMPVRMEGTGFRSGIEVWPYEDDFGRWVASHEHRVQAVVCETPEYRSSPFCGLGAH